MNLVYWDGNTPHNRDLSAIDSIAQSLEELDQYDLVMEWQEFKREVIAATAVFTELGVGSAVIVDPLGKMWSVGYFEPEQ